jgi:hypothetical protein
VVHTCNPSYLGGGDRRIVRSSSASWWDPISEHKQKHWGCVSRVRALVQGPRFIQHLVLQKKKNYRKWGLIKSVITWSGGRKRDWLQGTWESS